MVFAGFAVQFASDLIAAVLPAFVPTWLRLALFLAGILVFCLGASLYMTAALGTAPYDALAPMIVDGTRAPIARCAWARTSSSSSSRWSSTERSASGRS